MFNQKFDIPGKEICTRICNNESKQGCFGEKVLLQANYFRLSSHPDWSLYQHRVDITPVEDNTMIKKTILRKHADKLGPYLFDGSMLYLNNMLEEPLELHSVRESDKKNITIKIKYVGKVESGDNHYFQIFNIIMRKCLENLSLALIGRNYYDTKTELFIVSYNLKIWQGYLTSIRQHEAGVMMCSDILYKVLRSDTVYDLFLDVVKKNPNNIKDQLKKVLIGEIVITHHNNRTYKIDDVDFSVKPSDTFDKRDGTKITYSDYFLQKYNLKISDEHQPMLISRATARERRGGKSEFVYLVPEFCYTTGITDAMRKNFSLMKMLTEKTRISPSDRIVKLMDFHKQLTSKSHVVKDLKDWNMEIDEKLIDVPGRVLPKQQITFANSRVQAENGSWDLSRVPKNLLKVINLEDWVVVYPDKESKTTKEFIQLVIAEALRMGFEIEKPNLKILHNDNPESYANVLTKLTDTTYPQAVLCVVPNNQQQRYAAIKKKLCIDRGIPSQVILARTLVHRNVGSVACKVAVQLNCKLGGAPWTVGIKDIVKGLMVVGFDVCNDKSSRKNEFGAMVSSLDQDFGRYYSAVTRHKNGEELSQSILKNLGLSIGQFKIANENKLPKYIIIYRDGVGEGQIPFVYENEVEKIKERLENLYKASEKPLRFAFILVTKRINTRLFERKNNPRPGTVVDDVITDPLKYDFFIVSQYVHQGTVSPTAYNVIEDTTELSPDIIHYITYKLCHMYFNFNGTVRVPAPCQYAHKLATLVSQTLKESTHPDLQHLLYFL